MSWKRVTAWLQGIALGTVCYGGLMLTQPAQAQMPSRTQSQGMQGMPAPGTPVTPKRQMITPTRGPSDAGIQAARSSGKVWVNTGTGVYHKNGRWYGTTKAGKFMTEDEATRAGYHAARNEGKSK